MLTTSGSARGCSSAVDCSFNGECTFAGKCQCEAAWHGAYCERLSVLPGPRRIGYQGNEHGSEVSSWGGAPLLGDDGTYHLIASEMINHAGLLPWGCNSHIIHATSTDPLTVPFEKQRVLWPVFSHEPRCTRAPSGDREFVCYFSHNPHYPSAPCRGKDGNTDAQCRCNDGGAKPTYMSYAADIDAGNWSQPMLVVPSEVDLNLSPFIYPNNSLHALYRDNTGSNIHIITAADWREPASYIRHPGNLAGGVALPEDPFLYMDAKGRFHSLHHGYPWPNGPHAFSSDGWVWHKALDQRGSRGLAYGPNVTFSDSLDAFQGGCRERPSLIFAKDGTTPIALVNGFSPNPTKVGQ